ncbi:cation transporter [Pontibacter sp. HSC-14F20]|uniref:heavy-metal-associated domain-containing protein n=1 Tax=Pontibacter sp. HSC-14F20 TaxID=2864136 RepID=UPI001C737D78|nr:cation transporter [Pontibacter sp. HSC-14F20]MBX0334533.1 cation transporter [Pontibacter sp. HSC-14F20]
MKIFRNLSLVFVMLLAALGAQAQSGNEKTIQIKTSAVCDMCKKSLEKAMAYEKGVKKSNLDVDSKMLTVSFDPKKTNEDKIRKAVNDTGYDADDKPATPRAYNKLDDCCRKEAGAH